MKIAPKSHFHTTPVITLLGLNVNYTLRLYLIIHSLEWYNGPLAIVGFFALNLEVEAGGAAHGEPGSGNFIVSRFRQRGKEITLDKVIFQGKPTLATQSCKEDHLSALSASC